MLNTVSSNNSLVIWDKNINRSNILLSTFDGNVKVLKPYYQQVFTNMAELIKTGHCLNFVKCWQTICDNTEQSVTEMIHKALKSKDITVSDDSVNLVVNKFRGNLGEILVEMIFKSGLGSGICSAKSYTPVDPLHEQFIDAEGVSINTGLPIGIQVKNYSKHNAVKHETFIKSAAQHSLWEMHDKKIMPEDVSIWHSSPSQVIISMTGTEEILKKNYSGCVAFYGPEWFEGLRLQGDVKRGIPGRWLLFEKTANEISMI